MTGFTGFADQIDDTTISAGSFFPAFNVGTFQKNYRLPASYPSSTIVEHVKLAIIWACSALAIYQQAQIANSIDKLSDVPALMIGDEHEKELLFVRAVSCHAKALLLANYQTMMRKSDAVNDAKEGEDTADVWQAYASKALASITGKTSIMVEAL